MLIGTPCTCCLYGGVRACARRSFSFSYPAPHGSRGEPGVTEAPVRAIQGHSPCPHLELLVWGWGGGGVMPAASIHSRALDGSALRRQPRWVGPGLGGRGSRGWGGGCGAEGQLPGCGAASSCASEASSAGNGRQETQRKRATASSRPWASPALPIFHGRPVPFGSIKFPNNS